MQGMYRAELRVMTYSGAAKREPPKYLSEEPNRGSRSPTVVVEAKDFKDAWGKVQLILHGVMLDERVWQVAIMKLEKI